MAESNHQGTRRSIPIWKHEHGNYRWFFSCYTASRVRGDFISSVVMASSGRGMTRADEREANRDLLAAPTDVNPINIHVHHSLCET